MTQFYMRGGAQELPDLSPLASADTNKGWQSLSTGTLVLLAGGIGLVVTQATKFSRDGIWLIMGVPVKLD